MDQLTSQVIDKCTQVVNDLGGKDKALALGASGLAGCVSTYVLWKVLTRLPKLRVPLEPLESQDFPVAEKPLPVDPSMNLTARPGFVQCYDKATAERIGEVPDMTAEQVEECILKAKKAQVSWAKTSFATRRYFLQLLLKYTVEEKETICRVSMRDTGKSRLDAILGEIVPTAEKLRWMIENGEKVLQPEYRYGQGLLSMHKTAYIEYRPLPVLAIFAPNNYPYTNAMNHIISGCFAGCGAVIKVSEFTSWSSRLILRIVRKALVEVGGDPDLVQIVTGIAKTGEALCRSKNVDKIIFTGSDKIGKIIQRQASDNLTPCVLELGGKDPFIVFGDVDVDRVCSIAARGCFQNGGQNCIGIERIFVERKIEKRFIDRMVSIAHQIKVGPPINRESKVYDLGSLCTPVQIKHVEALIEDAKAKGAILHYGGKRITEMGPGLFFEPAVISGITTEMRIAHEEVFGPICAIRSFQTEDELIAMVNDCPFALGSSVFSNSSKTMRRVSKCIQAGMVNCNDFGINYLVQSLPFGGTKASGYGRFGGEEGLRACCQLVAVTEDKSKLMETNLPPAWKYPIAKNSFEAAAGLVELAYADTLSAKLAGLKTLLYNLMFTKPNKDL